jgi:hypothetical protein
MARVAKGADPTLVQKAVPLVKKLGDAKDSAKFDELQAKLKVARPMAAQILYAAEAVIDPTLKFKLTAANIEKARNRGLRWERIAAYTGSTVTNVKAVYEDGGGDISTSYVGKGKRPDGLPAENGASTKASTAKRGPGRPKGSKNKPAATTGGKTRRKSGLASRP